MKKTVPVDDAVGMVLPHDITEIRPGEFKGPAFRKGHIIRPEDVGRLKRLGKEHVYILELGPAEIHEEEAARRLCQALCGPGVCGSGEAVEGKITITAVQDGLLKIDTDGLYRFNLLGEVMCATLKDNTPVRAGEIVAGTRLIPLVGERSLLEKAVAVADAGAKIIRVVPYRKARVGVVVVGSEVVSGRISDAFVPVIRDKIQDIGSEVVSVAFSPDDPDVIAEEIRCCVRDGSDLVVATGGMSVDPDDVTRVGIMRAGACDIVYGTPVLPGAMFLVAYLDGVPVLGLPACGMFHKRTVFDVVLPRILAGERISRQQIAALGHGGLCRGCRACHFPACGFGR